MAEINVHRILPMAKRFLAKVVAPGDVVIDATAGNGNETYYLAGLVGEQGKVYAFDIQQQALTATAQKLGARQIQVALIHDGHQNVHQYVQEVVAAATFKTETATTIQSIDAILQLLKLGGIITVSVYEGHDGGRESKALLSYVKTLPQAKYHVGRYELINQVNNAPYLLLIERLA